MNSGRQANGKSTQTASIGHACPAAQEVSLWSTLSMPAGPCSQRIMSRPRRPDWPNNAREGSEPETPGKDGTSPNLLPECKEHGKEPCDGETESGPY